MIPAFPSTPPPPEGISIPGSKTASPSAPLRSAELRLRKHADYQRVYRNSRKQFSATMTWFLAARPAQAEDPAAHNRIPGPISSPGAGPRVGLTAGKVLGKAHERNRIKRRMREAVRRHVGELPEGVDLILHPRRAVMTMDFAKLEAEVLRIFRQAAGQARNPQARNSEVRNATARPAPPPKSSSVTSSKPGSKSGSKSRPKS